MGLDLERIAGMAGMERVLGIFLYSARRRRRSTLFFVSKSQDHLISVLKFHFFEDFSRKSHKMNSGNGNSGNGTASETNSGNSRHSRYSIAGIGNYVG